MRTSEISKECKNCTLIFISWKCENKKFCEQKCYWGYMVGKHSNKTGKKGSIPWNKGKKGTQIAWNKGIRTVQIIRQGKQAYDSRYKEWMLDVKKRDNWKCKISDEKCGGRLEAHYILSWKDFPELRYKINNGISLCVNHHPRQRSEEKRLSPYFTKLITSTLYE